MVYRHKAQSIEEALPELVIQPHQTHQNEAIRDLVIYDLPDFDSVLPENRVRVLRFLERLDVACWVVSPEKYADQALYDMLRISPQHPESFIFILNKIDQYVDYEGRFDLEKTTGVLDDFRHKLGEVGVLSPKLYALSAMTGGTNLPSAGDFQNFRDLLYRKRREKEIRSIKLANIEHELNGLISAMSHYPDLEGLTRTIEALLSQVKKEFDQTRTICSQMIRSDLDDSSRMVMRPLWLKREKRGGVVLSLLRWTVAVQNLLGSKRQDGFERLLPADKEAVESMVHRMDSLSNRVNASLARFPKAEFVWSTKPEFARVHDRISATRREWIGEIRAWFAEGKLPNVVSGYRRFKYRVILALPVPAMLFYLADPSLLAVFREHPSFAIASRIVSGVLFAFFQSKGLVAMFSLFLIEALLVVILARRVLDCLDARIDDFYEQVRHRYEKALESVIAEFEEDVTRSLLKLQAAAAKLARLEARAGGPNEGGRDAHAEASE
ncbi:MAG: hypothetical protein HY788_18505 [Deltaproteobacteria bacterium]|nr:hypothetical protein [Deltaproteobacteria bacterium]